MSDWIIALGALSHSAARIAVGRVRSGTPPTPRTAADLTPQYLDAVLAVEGSPCEVLDVEHLGGHAGTTARDRVALRYRDGHTSVDRPGVLFAKLAPANFSTALFVHLMGLGANEVRFYRDLAPEVPACTPRVYSAQMTADAVRFCILFEDLTARGCTFRRIGDDLGADFAEAVVVAMAAYHARFWDSARFDGDLAWLPRHACDPIYPVARLMCRLAHGPSLRYFGDALPGEFADGIRMLYDRRDALEDVWAEGPVTLIHGDPHIGNLYAEPDGTPGFLDWQLARVGQGIRDVAHFLISSLDPALRREREDALLVRYVAALKENGVEDFGLERARAQYRLHTLYEWFAVSVTAAAASLQPRAVVMAGLERAVAAIEDWDALDALADL
jgi:hypothetical protein